MTVHSDKAQARRQASTLRSVWPEMFGSARPPDAPSYFLTASEPARSVLDVQQMLWSLPWLMTARRGDGHAVLVLPGLMSSDSATQVLRSYLRFLGYRVYGWSLGRNMGPTRAVLDELPAAVERIAEGGKVSLVGWSLGGIYARNLAHHRASQVRQVITLGSPYRSPAPGRQRAHGAARENARLRATEGPVPSRRLSGRRLRVPSTSIYSKWDGVVAWQRCIEPAGPMSENVQVRASHFGLGFDPYTLWTIADRLAQPAGSWRPFRAPLPLRLFYPIADEG